MDAVMQGRTEMKDVKVETAKLLVKVKENREKHIAEFDEALSGYKDTAKAEIRKAMGRLESRIDELESGDIVHLGAVRFDLAVPENHEKDYDQVIAMLEMSVDEEVTIKSDEFACYVMDNWTWKDDFVNVSNSYKKHR